MKTKKDYILSVCKLNYSFNEDKRKQGIQIDIIEVPIGNIYKNNLNLLPHKTLHSIS